VSVTRTPPRLVGALLTATVALLSAESQAALTTDQCIDANARAQDLRRELKLALAREQLGRCVDSSCPALVRSDCTKLLDELEKAQPMVTFEVKDAGGSDVATATITLDGKMVSTKADGRPIALDPGQHELRLEAPRMLAVTRTMVLSLGDKSRHERIVLTPLAPPSSVDSPAPERGHGMGVRRVVGISVGSAGIAGLVTAASSVS
jgi:hypothetical protein